MAELPTFRLGSIWYALAEGVFDITGQRPLVERRQSIFPGRTNTPGLPGIQNVQDSDLRWGISDFAGGEGQYLIQSPNPGSFVQTAGLASPFKSYARSDGVDLSRPGQIRLSQAMQEKGSSGSGVPVTVEASAFVDDMGTSTVVGTDRKLINNGDRVRDDATVAAGLFQFDFYGYEGPAMRWDGTRITEITPHTNLVGSVMRLTSDGAIAGKHGQTPSANGPVTIRTHVTAPTAVEGPPATSVISLLVQDHASGNLLAHTAVSLALNKQAKLEVSFTAVGGHTYDYFVKARSLNGAQYAGIDWLEEDPQDDRALSWTVLSGSTVLATGVVPLNGTTMAGTKIASTTLNLGAGTYRIRMGHNAGASRDIFADKVIYRAITMADPRVVELGLNDRLWLVDHSANAPSVLYWDAQTDKWISVGTAGPAGAVACALAHTDHYEFVALDDKKVYHSTMSAIAVHTNATTDPIVGITVGGNRLFILTESVASGTQLFTHPLEGAAAGPTSVVSGLNPGITPDAESPQRMAGTASGVVFFANQGPDCFVFLYDGAATTPVNKMPTGFRGTAICFGSELIWLAGVFPVVDNAGTTRYRPAVFLVPTDGTAPTLLDTQLWREDDPKGSKIVAMQLYTTDLWLAVEVPGDAPSARLWRLSLREGEGAFVHHAVLTAEAQAAGHLRGLAITWAERLVAWSVGAPWMEQDSYQTSGTAYLQTSLYDFGLTELKELKSIDLVADIPDGCSIVLSYRLDGGSWAPLSFTASGRRKVSLPGSSVLFSTLEVKIELLSADPALTPVFYRAVPRAFSTVANKIMEVVLSCLKTNSVWRLPDGYPASATQGAANIKALAEAGVVVEFEDRYTDPAQPRIGVCSIVDSHFDYVKNGESLAHLTLLEEV